MHFDLCSQSKNLFFKHNCQPYRWMVKLDEQNSNCSDVAQIKAPKLDRYFSDFLFWCAITCEIDWFYLHIHNVICLLFFGAFCIRMTFGEISIIVATEITAAIMTATKQIQEVKEPRTTEFTCSLPVRSSVCDMGGSSSIKEVKRKAYRRWIENDLRARFCCFELSHLQLTKILRKCERVYIRNDRTIIIVINMIM